MGLTPEALLAEAERAAAHAHAPHSGLRVGAVAEDAVGGLHPGVNVESSSFGLTLCAERTALARAVTDGAGEIVAIAVARADGAPIVPCGACRQVLADLAPGARVVHRDAAGDVAERPLGDLLPHAFDLPA